MRVLHPQQFEVNEAWIAFRINDAPIRTEVDGEFNCLALMDAASCFILGFEFYSARAVEPTQQEFRRLIESARSHKQELPATLFIARDVEAKAISCEATEHGIEVVRVPESELEVFIGEAREGFAEQFE